MMRYKAKAGFQPFPGAELPGFHPADGFKDSEKTLDTPPTAVPLDQFGCLSQGGGRRRFFPRSPPGHRHPRAALGAGIVTRSVRTVSPTGRPGRAGRVKHTSPKTGARASRRFNRASPSFAPPSSAAAQLTATVSVILYFTFVCAYSTR